jgi:hypothetical protein
VIAGLFAPQILGHRLACGFSNRAGLEAARTQELLDLSFEIFEHILAIHYQWMHLFPVQLEDVEIPEDMAKLKVVGDALAQSLGDDGPAPGTRSRCLVQ